MADWESLPPEQRLAELERQWREQGSTRVLLQLAEEYRGQERLTDAIGLLEEGLARHPDYVGARVALGRYRLEAGSAEQAREVLEDVVAQDPTQMVANRALVEAYIAIGEYAKARDRLDFYALLNEADPTIPELRLELAERIVKDRRPPRTSAVAAEVSRPLPAASASGRPEPPRAAASTGAAVAAGGGLASRGDAGEPFPFLGARVERATLLRSLLAEGIFTAAGAATMAGAAATLAGPAAVQPAPGFRIERRTADRVAPAAAAEPVSAWSPAEPAAASEEESAATGAPARIPVEVPPPTPTLGQLYLDQGHPEEAAAIFRQVLGRDPHNAAAREGMRAAAAARGRLSAWDLVDDGGERSPGRLMRMLRAYLDRLRGRFGEGGGSGA